LPWAIAFGSVLGCSHAVTDQARGRALFESRCALCHSIGVESTQGPGLGGVLGRRAAGNRSFGGYSRALRASTLVWDRSTLDRFLAGPAGLVPGTSMAITVDDPQDRAALIAYLSTLAGPGSETAPIARGPFVPVPPATPGLRRGKAAFAGYRDDGPGVRRRLTVADLPAPFATPSVRRAPRVVSRPEGAELHVPPGFHVDAFASDLDDSRLLRVAPNGDVFVAESNQGRIRVLRAADGSAHAEENTVFATGVKRPFGIAFYPPGPEPHWLYVAETNAIVRFPYTSGDVVARGLPEVVVPKLTDSSGGHWTRDVAFSADGQRMFVSVGSASNVAEKMSRRSLADANAWEASHGVGAGWDDEERRADVLVMTPEGRNVRTYATGIRNCVGLALAPATGDVWCATNERDGLGDDLVPDYVTRVREGGYYGWPWYYLGDHEDPRLAGQRPDLAGKALQPDVLLQPHSAALELVFYDGAMFPPDYRGNVFVALHGSWNRSDRTGYKVVRIPVVNGVPSAEYEDFLTGFVVSDDEVWGRPVGVEVAHDGALLVSEDGNGTVWRVSYGAPRGGEPGKPGHSSK
jgi:glucose/arabinose dehydrogenase/cytochrome c2